MLHRQLSRFPRRIAAGIAALVLGIAAPALADPIRITSGSINYSRQNQAMFRAMGSTGLQILTDFGSDSGEFWNPNHVCFGCTPGARIEISQSESFDNAPGSDVGASGSVIVRGVDYWIRSMSFHVDAGTFVIPDSSGDRWLTSNAGRFLFQGVIRGRSDAGATLMFDLIGSGRASLAFSNNDWFDTTYTFEDPAAVPEPATMLLFGTGLAAAIARRRKPPQTVA